MASDFLLKFVPIRTPTSADRQALIRAMGQQIQQHRSGLSLLPGTTPKMPPKATQRSRPEPIDIPLHYRVWGMSYNSQKADLLRSYGAIADLFQRDGVDGRLLIVGEAGMGKTHTLLAVAEILLHRAAQSSAPVPVLVDLSAWQGETMRNWLIEYLWVEYRVAKNLAESWIDTGQLSFFWDGFDHLPTAQKRSCAGAIETLLRSNTNQTALLCCRRKVIEETGITFSQFNSGVLIVPMAAQQVKDYVMALKRPDLWQRIKGDRVLQQLARFPLCLNMLTLVSKRQPVKNRKELIQQFIAEQVTTAQPGQSTAAATQDMAYLSWLARQLDDRPRLFRLEALQRTWLPDSRRFLYRLLLGLCVAMVLGLIAGNLILGLALGLMVSQVDVDAFPRYQLSLATASGAGLGSMMLAATVPALIGGTILGGLGALLLSRFGLGLTAFAGGAMVGIVIGWFAGLGLVLWGGLQHGIQVRQTLNQDIRLGFRNTTLLFGWLGVLLVLFSVLGAVVSGQPPLTLLSISRLRLLVATVIFAIVWLSGGLQQSLVRFLLATQPRGSWPLNCLPYLRRWTHQRLLRQVGGGFCFSHELIRQVIAQQGAAPANFSTSATRARERTPSSQRSSS